ncbi:type II toxin-antitoxin system PemK/MazF family toxin [Methylobacterium sp. J-092]|uniref:type II toxin-antitoxin system PemK/MazF family toxin n=1 Tax=Methylobacterium sp. J-092 TaxID=2836667 RepID=UPI001FB91A69|nr:type II toxin-antitoxin system PemK/MazF family toxin [Methylobacterium sp. J-092]MCJ2009747.1 type II toxin-antitoxin system PemK/MazF family toxin [Methylobacterium sp. J-092]
MPISEADALAPGAVVVVPFPYSDRLHEKRRPALVISGPDVEAAGFVWIAMITSGRNPSKPRDLPIDDLDRAGLTHASVVRPIKIACIDPARVLKRIGALPPAAAEQVFATIRSMVGPTCVP